MRGAWIAAWLIGMLPLCVSAAPATQPIAGAADWAVRRERVLEGMQAVMGPLPGVEKKVQLNVRVEEEITLKDSLRRRKITLQAYQAAGRS